MCLEFKDYQEYFKDYCKAYNLDFEKVLHLPKTCGSEFVAIQYSDGTRGKSGLLDETPMPPVLWLKTDSDKKTFTIEQTEYTDKYIAL